MKKIGPSRFINFIIWLTGRSYRCNRCNLFKGRGAKKAHVCADKRAPK